jgi:hypothetical protein
MTMTFPMADLPISGDLRQADAALDGVLLKQTGLLATLVTARRETGSAPLLGHAELMRLVKSQQSLLSPSGELGRIQHDLKNTSGHFAAVRQAA